MGKQELYDTLLGLGYTEETLTDSDGKKFKRPVLLDMLQSHKHGEEGIAILSEISEDNDDDVGMEIPQDTKSEQEDNIDCSREVFASDPPTPSDKGWTQYVLGKFMDDEVDGQNPRVEGLRRVAGELIGEVIEEGCDLVAPPSEENRFRACVKAWAVFLTDEGREKRFEALADAHSDNCFESYATYLVAMADTRAKGRVFRNALMLRRVVAAEEVNKTMATSEDIQQGGSIHTGQLTMIRIMAERNKFSVSDILDKLSIAHEVNDKTGDVNLKELSYEDALNVAKTMREMAEQKGEE
jgi:hypothetical protein